VDAHRLEARPKVEQAGAIFGDKNDNEAHSIGSARM